MAACALTFGWTRTGRVVRGKFGTDGRGKAKEVEEASRDCARHHFGSLESHVVDAGSAFLSCCCMGGPCLAALHARISPFPPGQDGSPCHVVDGRRYRSEANARPPFLG